MNLEFTFEEPPIVFEIEKLNEKLLAVHERALHRAQKYLVSEAELLESIIEVDQLKLYEKFGEAHLTPYCVKHLGLSEDVAAVFVRVARRSVKVPELRQAIVDGELCVNKAKTIASVITGENPSEWIEKAKSLSKHKLEREVAAVFPVGAKPEKARHIGENRVQITLSLTVAEYDRRGRIKDLVSQNLSKSATDSEVEVAMIELYEFHKDPIRKAERAAKKKYDRSRDRSLESGNLPARVEHEVNLRDRGECQARHADGSICRSTRWVHQHHIVPKSQGGKDVVENLITLCSAHHRLWHKRER